jgi:hypothetical protein
MSSSLDIAEGGKLKAGSGTGLAVCAHTGVMVTAHQEDRCLRVWLPVSCITDTHKEEKQTPPWSMEPYEIRLPCATGFLAFAGPASQRMLLLTDFIGVVHILDVGNRSHTGILTDEGVRVTPRIAGSDARVAVLRSAAVVTIYNFTDGGWSVGRGVELAGGHFVHGLVFRDADSPSLIVSREMTATVCLPVEEEGSSRTSWDDLRVQGGCVAHWGNDVLLVARRNNVLAVMQAGGAPEFHDVGIRKPYLQTPLNSIACVPGVGFAFRRCSGSVVFLNWAGVEMAKAGRARVSVSAVGGL